MTTTRRDGSSPTLARLADRDEGYARLGLARDHVAPWEDGTRTAGVPESYEWWYFDSHLADGSSLVITFYTRWILKPDGPLAPMITVNLDRPGRSTRQLTIKAKPEEFTASRDRCDVRLKECYFRGDLHTYQIRIVDDQLTIDVELVGEVPAWRPATGFTYFGPNDEHTFAWLPSVPQGRATVTLSERGSAPETLTGIGYHDHNWGDVVMSKLLNHWYWGRAQAGPYSVIASYLYAEKAYGQTELPMFMLAKDGQPVADGSGKAHLTLEDVTIDPRSGKPVAGRVIYEYAPEESVRYRVIFQREETILDYELADTVTGIKHVLARLARMDGAYIRFSGTVTVEKYVAGRRVEQASDPGIWELMYLGHTEEPAHSGESPRREAHR